MFVRLILIFSVFFFTVSPQSSNSREMAPDSIYPALEYVFSLFNADTELESDKVSALVDLVQKSAPDTSLTLKGKKDAEGAFYSFDIQGTMGRILDYAYNPDIPAYITMPSSVQNLEWMQPESNDELRNLLEIAKSANGSGLLRGREQEAITPDTNTGGYYIYAQDRIIAVFSGATGPVLISATIQDDKSEVGKKGCIVGKDKDWNYLFSEETGLNKTGLGWADSYLYSANSVVVYVADSSQNVVHVGSFKWLNAGWAGINMVKSGHILKGIKRFASDFKTILEAPGLPEATELAKKYKELLNMSKPELQVKVSPFIETLSKSESFSECPGKLRRKVSSGEYLEKMSQNEMIRVVMLEYVKTSLGKDQKNLTALLDS